MSTREQIPMKGQPVPASGLMAASWGTLQRKCDCGGSGGGCAECRKKKNVQRRRGNHTEPGSVPPIVHEVLRSAGQPLDAATRAYFEPRFGHDFSKVRIHAGDQAAESAYAINARAYTVGQHLILGAERPTLHSTEGRKLLAHELTHVVQQKGSPETNASQLKIGPAADALEYQAESAADAIGREGWANQTIGTSSSSVQRDLALPPAGPPAAAMQLTEAQIAAAIRANQARFSDPYSIRLIRDVLGLTPTPAVVDEEMVRAVAQWQAERNLRQDGEVGHLTTRSIYLELVAASQFRDAILLLMDSYRLPGDFRLNDIRIGNGADCCGADHTDDAITSGGPNCPPVGGPVTICFCQDFIPRTAAAYDHFIRIVGHELIHVPQCAAGTGDVNVDEFEATFFEACAAGRAPQLSAAERVAHANDALADFANIPAHLQTPARTHMRDQLNALIAANGVGPC